MIAAYSGSVVKSSIGNFWDINPFIPTNDDDVDDSDEMREIDNR